MQREGSKQRKRFSEEVVWYVVQESLLEVRRRFGGKVFDPRKIFLTGLSLGGEGVLNMAAMPGVGRCLAGIVPTACRGSDHRIFTDACLQEMWHLPIWATQIATDRKEYRMNQMLEFVASYGAWRFTGSEAVVGESGEEMLLAPPAKKLEHVEYPDDDEYEGRTQGPLWEYHREVRKFAFPGAASKELWEIWDSRSDTWTGWQDQVWNLTNSFVTVHVFFVFRCMPVNQK